MHLLSRIAPALLILAVAGCGGISEGQDCDTGGYACEDGSSALECREGTWTRLPCRGPSGCSEDGSAVTCDTSAALEGDACGLSAAGRGLCAEGGTALLECRKGFFVKTASCSSCSVQSGQVICTP